MLSSKEPKDFSPYSSTVSLDFPVDFPVDQMHSLMGIPPQRLRQQNELKIDLSSSKTVPALFQIVCCRYIQRMQYKERVLGNFDWYGVIFSLMTTCHLLKRRKCRKKENVQMTVDVNWENCTEALFHLSSYYENTKLQKNTNTQIRKHK